MGFFARGGDRDAEQLQELERIEAGGIPRRAEERLRALDRLREEAVQVGADAVVGVHLQRSDHDLGRGTIEYVVSGTAIRIPGSAGTSWPVLTDVSVQDYCRLRSAGRAPVGFLATTVVVFASPSRATRFRRPGALPRTGSSES
jgi:Putative heavy-metal-binding